MSAESIFTLQGDRFVPSAYARGPWDPGALHGGAAAALIVQELERRFPADGMQTGRLSFQLLRPVPAKPLRLTTAIVRNGRRVRELGAELFDEDTLVCRAKALRVQPVSPEIAARPGESGDDGAPGESGDDGAPADAMPGPDDGDAVRFALDDPSRPSFATAMDMRWLTEPFALGPGRVWMRMRLPLLPGRPAGPLALLAAVCDFGNGVSSELRFDQYLFINADLTLHLQRAPRGEWAGIDARMLLAPQGAGLAESVAYDAQGAVGRAFQTLVVEPRG
jgi:Acyl-CoA thioesterase C-terminal domain/Acyl-CoA thioesterase N-terminal domain